MGCLCQRCGCSEPVECGDKFCGHHFITECYHDENETLKENQKESN